MKTGMFVVDGLTTNQRTDFDSQRINTCGLDTKTDPTSTSEENAHHTSSTYPALNYLIVCLINACSEPRCDEGF